MIKIIVDIYIFACDLKVLDMYVLIPLIVVMTLIGKANSKFNVNNTTMSKYELSLGYGYSSASISTTEYQINSPTYDARHNLHTQSGFDNNTGLKLAFIPNGEDSSIRLGNSNNGSQSEKIRYTFNVNEKNIHETMTYQYALVFQTPNSNNNIDILPKFEIKIYKNKQLFEVALEANPYSTQLNYHTVYYPGNRIIKWTDWDSGEVDLSQFDINDTITLEFETYDCANGKLFGYGYLVIS